MCINDVGLPILDQAISVVSLHEDCIPHIHVGDSKHYSTYIKGYYIQFHSINKINTYNKFDLTLFRYLYVCILVYPTQWIGDMMIMNPRSKIFDQIHCYEIIMWTRVEQSVYLAPLELNLDVEELGHLLLLLVMKDTRIHLLLHKCAENISIHIQATFNLISWIRG